jgi:hypothetical protein
MENQDYGHSHRQGCPLWGIGLQNFSIVGPGLIHGEGLNPGFDRFADEAKGKSAIRTAVPARQKTS